ncbi:MAG: hypothetical protein JXN64_10050 [Spirochaetes bacterium]|nr:hypothetical protein [Spirochaetota bacterium]
MVTIAVKNKWPDTSHKRKSKLISLPGIAPNAGMNLTHPKTINANSNVIKKSMRHLLFLVIIYIIRKNIFIMNGVKNINVRVIKDGKNFLY